MENDNFRLRLKSIEYSTTNSKAEVMVTLEKEEECFEAKLSGPNTASNISKMLAKATLCAIEKFCGVSEFLLLEDVSFSAIAGREVAIVAVVIITGSGEQLLSGSAIINKDKKEAVVRATLDAVNRSITKYQCNTQAG